MYLHELYVRNNGPIEKLHLELAFNGDGLPIPHVIVGRNGVGKTNFLSLIGDALMEGAAAAYRDILSFQDSSRRYFRVLGGKTIKYGSEGSYSILRFEEDGEEYFYHEVTSGVNPAEAATEVPAQLSGGAIWTEGNSAKSFGINDKSARKVFQDGVFAFFPSSRSEHPFWFNQGSVAVDSYSDRDKYTQNLDRPMFVEHGIDSFAQWLLGVITESRLDVMQAGHVPDNEDRVTVELDIRSYWATQQALLIANQIIQIITDDPHAKFAWAGRHSSRKLAILTQGRPLVASLDGLSGGQATLLSIFGTILRYGDEASDRTIPFTGDMKGIVIIDELDAHMHIDLQMEALPLLIKIFPKIQFIVSSHSPLFVLGMERHFSSEGLRVVEMPSGRPLDAEGYQEFGHALEALGQTQAFAKKVEDKVTENERPVVLLAGQTDLKYFSAAARLLGFEHLVDRFLWIGEPDGGRGGKNTGDHALSSAVSFLKANPEMSNKKVIAVYDCDANKVNERIGNVYVLGLPTLPNRTAKKGIENMLPNTVFKPEFYQNKYIEGQYGDDFTRPELNKMKLCDSLCGADAESETFSEFRPILEQIESMLSGGNEPNMRS
ncbi:AAA family ATPase [Nocardia salmonicida]|uniref:AAA family ATPase n=1 Tax=Nocardia salmonicida TaxID=53431 RepID=UPI0033CFB565